MDSYNGFVDYKNIRGCRVLRVVPNQQFQLRNNRTANVQQCGHRWVLLGSCAGVGVRGVRVASWSMLLLGELEATVSSVFCNNRVGVAAVACAKALQLTVSRRLISSGSTSCKPLPEQ